MSKLDLLASRTSGGFDPKIRLGHAVTRVLCFLIFQSRAVLASEIRDATGVPSGSLSPAIARLNATGVVELADTDQYWQHPVKGRQRRRSIRLTDAGRYWASAVVFEQIVKPLVFDNSEIPEPRAQLRVIPAHDGGSHHWEVTAPGSRQAEFTELADAVAYFEEAVNTNGDAGDH